MAFAAGHAVLLVSITAVPIRAVEGILGLGGGGDDVITCGIIHDVTRSSLGVTV